MKNWILIVLSAALSMACSEDSSERIDENKLRAMVAKQRAEAEKTGKKEVEYDSVNVAFTSKDGDFEVAQNDAGDVLIVGDQSIIWNYDTQARLDVASIGSDVDASVNSKGEWIAIGNDAVIVKLEGEQAKLYTSLNHGSTNSKFSAHINENGDWIAGGNNGVFINGIKLNNIRISDRSNSIKVHIDDDRKWGVIINNDVKTGVFIPESSENLNDDSSLQ